VFIHWELKEIERPNGNLTVIQPEDVNKSGSFLSRKLPEIDVRNKG
jgi:hypothetical protein